MSFFKRLFSPKDLPIQTYSDFWKWFVKHEKQFFKVVKKFEHIERDFFDKLAPKIQQINKGIFYLTGMYNSETAELVFTADGNLKNVIFIEELVAASPKLDGWKFTALKPSLDIDSVGIEMNDYQFNGDNLSFYSNDLEDYPDEIDITVVHEEFTPENESAITTGSYIFLDNFLGELEFATQIDEINVVGPAEAEKALVPIAKLKDFLKWREKEFIERYDDTRYDTENDEYAIMQATLKSGLPLIAVINTDLLNWESKASHPWILVLILPYDGEHSNGLPLSDNPLLPVLEEIEGLLLKELKDFEGYLNIGRQSAENAREIYYACKDFRKPSKILDKIVKQYADKLEIEFDIYKDKYWQSFNRFRQVY